MKPLKADLLILLVTMCWGSSYLFMKIGLDSLSAFNIVALRYGLAFLLCLPILVKRYRAINLKTVIFSFALGFLLFAVSASIIFGLKNTTASNAGFLAGLTVIFVPLLSALIVKKKPESNVIAGVLVSMVGIGLLTLNDRLSIMPGDFLCMLAALLYAIHILLTGSAAKAADIVNLGILQLGFAGGFGLLFAFIYEVPMLPSSYESWKAVLVLSVVCSAFGYIAQTIAQKYTTPTHTGLIFSLEPVFAAIFAYFFAHELLPIKGYVGAAIILLGVMIAEIKRLNASSLNDRSKEKRSEFQP